MSSLISEISANRKFLLLTINLKNYSRRVRYLDRTFIAESGNLIDLIYRNNDPNRDTGSRSMEEETNVSNSSVRRCFLSYSIKPILGIYETITSWLSFVIVTDRSVGPAERTSKPVLRSWAGVRDSRKEVKILSRAADHHSRFGREPREQFLPFPFFLSSSSSFPRCRPSFARETPWICMRSVTD